MNVLTDEQKNYIKEHPCESPCKLAKSFGCTVQTIYWWLHKLHGNSFIQMKKKAKEERNQVIRDLYPTHSATEVGKRLGIAKASVNDLAKRLGVKHTDETAKRIQKESVARTRTDEANRKRQETLRKILAVEKLRAASGLPQKTKRKFKTVPGKCMNARNYLCRKYNYFYDKDYGELLTLFFDSDTRMLNDEQKKHYETEYSIKFLQAEED